MTEQEQNAFKRAIKFYEKWRSTIIETDEQWEAFADDVGQMGIEMSREYSPLAQRLFEAVVNAIGDLYMNGMKPMPANYFGRDDL